MLELAVFVYPALHYNQIPSVMLCTFFAVVAKLHTYMVYSNQ